jgi:hypothetical protein
MMSLNLIFPQKGVYWNGGMFDVRGSVHRSTIHTEKPDKMQQSVKICYSIFI